MTIIMNSEESYIVRFLIMNNENFFKDFGFLTFFTLVILVSFSCEKNVKLDPEPLNRILDRYVHDGVYPFLYSRIEDSGGRVVYEHSVVNSELLPGIHVDSDTWIRIWSMSKLVTISIAMDLIEDGIISLEDPVVKYIPEFKNLKVAVNSDGISLARLNKKNNPFPFSLVSTDSGLIIENLFDHTAGFYYALTGFAFIDSIIAEVDIPNQKNGNALIQELAQLPLIQNPGEIYKYGMNTTVLGLLLERATGQSLNDLVINRITKPYKIQGLGYTLPDNVSLIPCFTGRDGYLRQAMEGELNLFGGNVPDYDPDKNLFLGGEGMLATAKGYIDFMRLLFFDSHLNGIEFLSKKSLTQMTLKPEGKHNDYGYQTGYAFYLTSDNNPYEKNILRVGGYEKTSCWVDRKYKLIGILFSQANETVDRIGLGSRMDNDFKKELRRQLSNYE